MKRVILIYCLLCFGLTAGWSQSMEKSTLFSQYKFMGLSINPAYAGSHEVFSASMMNRAQLIGFEGAPVFQNLNFHFPGKKTQTGWGGNVFHESLGTRNYFSLYANYAYRIKAGPGTLALGLKAGLIAGKHEILDELGSEDPVYATDNENFMLPNFGIGFYYYTARYYAGLSIPQLLGYESPKGTIIADADLDQATYFLTAGYYFFPDPDWRLNPSVLAQYVKEPGFVADITMNLLYKEVIGGGLSYRTSKALIAMLSYRFGYQTTVGLAYDFGFLNRGELPTYHTNSFEIAIQVDLGFKINRANPTLF